MGIRIKESSAMNLLYRSSASLYFFPDKADLHIFERKGITLQKTISAAQQNSIIRKAVSRAIRANL